MKQFHTGSGGPKDKKSEPRERSTPREQETYAVLQMWGMGAWLERLSLPRECRLEKMEEELPSQGGEGGNF